MGSQHGGVGGTSMTTEQWDHSMGGLVGPKGSWNHGLIGLGGFLWIVEQWDHSVAGLGGTSKITEWGDWKGSYRS